MTARIIGNGGENVTPQVTAQTSLIEQMSAALNNGDGAPYFIPEYPMTEDLIPSAIDTDGSVFNGIGYLPDYRWSGSKGTVVASTGSYITGYIPFTVDDIIYCKPSNRYISLTDYVIAFDANFNLLGIIFNAVSLGWSMGESFYQKYETYRYSNVAYIRVSGSKASGVPTIRKAIK